MKKFGTVILFIALLLASNYIYLGYLSSSYDKKINKSYCDSIGNKLYPNKNQGQILQKISFSRPDNLPIFGSSELSTDFIPTNPMNFFRDKKDGFQVNLIGRGYSQDFIHAMDFLSLGDNLEDKKAVVILSPQWFEAAGLSPSNFNMNFSELQFYSIMFNNKIEKQAKLHVASRVNYLLKGTKDYPYDEIYSYLYSKDNLFTESILAVLTPYYKYKYRVLQVKDKIEAYKIVKENESNIKTIPPKKTEINWEQETAKAESLGKSSCTNNDFGIYDDYYNTYVKPNLQKEKGISSKGSYLNSPEYDDLKFLLETAKKLNMKILFISVPVNGAWYDYTGFPESDRQQYYKKVKDLVTSYGFQIEDYSGSEHEKYFFCDVMHLGWKGWVKIDEAIDKFYHEN